MQSSVLQHAKNHIGPQLKQSVTLVILCVSFSIFIYFGLPYRVISFGSSRKRFSNDIIMLQFACNSAEHILTPPSIFFTFSNTGLFCPW